MHAALFLRHTTQLSTPRILQPNANISHFTFHPEKNRVKQQNVFLLVCREQIWEAQLQKKIGPFESKPSNEVSELQIQCLAIRDASE